MNALKKVLMGVLAVAALGLGGAALAGATSGSGSSSGAEQESADEQVGGTTADKAGAAATKAVGGGSVLSVERSDEGGKAAYEVKVNKSGTVTEVNLDSSFGVTAQQVDDDQGGAETSDGDGETDDDAGQ